jgi:hypothetical protein
MNYHTGTTTVGELREALAHLDADAPVLVDIAGLPTVEEAVGVRKAEHASDSTGLRTLRLSIS